MFTTYADCGSDRCADAANARECRLLATRQSLRVSCPRLVSCTLSRSHASWSQPEVGAQCVSSARWDLCGGCRVTGIPTATGGTPWVGSTMGPNGGALQSTPVHSSAQREATQGVGGQWVTCESRVTSPVTITAGRGFDSRLHTILRALRALRMTSSIRSFNTSSAAEGLTAHSLGGHLEAPGRQPVPYSDMSRRRPRQGISIGTSRWYATKSVPNSSTRSRSSRTDPRTIQAVRSG